MNVPNTAFPHDGRATAELAHKLGVCLTAGMIAWGALAFGAVYPWAYWVLAAMAVGVGAVGMSVATKSGASDGRRGDGVSRGLAIALITVAGLVGLQLIPLGLSILRAVNPNGVDLLRQTDVVFAAGQGTHPLSVWPQGTRLALALFGAFSLLLIGATKLISATGARRLIEMLIVVGVVVALIGIVQKPVYAGKIYGFWAPHQQGAIPFGPFVNRNHFAGWMLMVLPLALGYLSSGIARGMRGVEPTLRHRVLWFSSPDSNKLLLAAMAIVVMGLAIAMTLSRSGISALGVALSLTGWFALRRLQGGARKALAAGYLVLIVMLIAGWVGVDTLVTRFAASEWNDVGARSGAWADATATFRRHWLTGTGLNTYQIANLVYQQHNTQTFTSAAHNDYLQMAAEGGVLLVSAVALCAFLFVRDVRRRFGEDGDSSAYWLRFGAVTGVVAIAIQEAVEFSLQIPGNAALFVVLCAIALHKSPQRSMMKPRSIKLS